MRGVQEGAAVLAFVVIVAASSLIVSKPAHADSFSVTAGSAAPECFGTGSTPQAKGCTFEGFANFGQGKASAFASANLSSVGASVETTILGIPFIAVFGGFEAIASETLSFIINGPSTGGFLQTIMNVSLDGAFSGGCPENWACETSFDAIVRVGLQETPRDSTSSRNRGVFASPTIFTQRFETKEFDFLPGVPFNIFYRLIVTASVNNFSEAGLGSVSSNFSETFGPARTGPVFNLPEGFTAFGPCVENNRFVCAANGTPGPVPAPGSLALLTLGVAGLAVWRRGRG